MPVKTKKRSAKATADLGLDGSRMIDNKIAGLADWRAGTLSKVRELILAAVPGTIEEWKWANPVWSNQGIICTGETYKKVVKLTFMNGAKLPDPKKLFNSSLEGATRRAIDIKQGEKVDEAAFKALIKAAAAFNKKG